jgi:hypothetical protein
MHRTRRMTAFLLALPATLFLFALCDLPAFAQGATSPPVDLSPAFVLTTALAAVIGALTQAYNVGSLFGIVTVPRPALPYVGLALSFLTGFGVSLGSTPTMTAATFYVAILAGLGALMANGGGAAVHGLVTAHKTSRGVAATEAASPVPPVVMVPMAPVSATDVTKPDALTPGKVAGKIGPAAILVLIVGLSVFVPKQAQEVPCVTAETVQTTDTVTADAPPAHCFLAVEGCSWWTANSKPVVTDIGSIASCVISQSFLGVSAPATIVGSCIGATIADVEEIVASVVSFYDHPDAGAPVDDAGLAVAMWHSSRFGADIELHVPPTVDKPTLARLHAVRAN